MKQKKKMLLAMAAISVVAVGVGTTSTFAWYTSSAASKITVGAATYGVGSTSTEVSLDNVTVVIALAQSGAGVELSYVVTTADVTAGLKTTGNVTLAANDVIYGAMKNGTELFTAKWDGNNSTKRLIGQYTIDTDSTTGTRITTSLTLGQKESLKNKQFTAALSTEGHAEILSVTSLSGAMSDAAATAAAPTVTIAFNSTGDGIDFTKSSISNPYFAIRASAKDALEADHTGDNIKVNASPEGGYTLTPIPSGN